jgi:fucose 4-O-acetylase-like acetyltransferase
MPATLTRLPSTTRAASHTSMSPDDGPQAAPVPSRDPWFDNAKLLLVTLVVLGHSWTLVGDSFTTSWAYNFLYLWHVPAFVMVTGYLSRSFRFSRRHLSKLLTTVVVPYLVFEYTLTTFRSEVGGEHFGPLFLNPHWPMWYLATLFVWRLATPLLKRLPHALPVALVVSLVGGAFTGDTLDLARATGLLPFFVMGLLATPGHLAVLRRPAARLAAYGAFGLALVASTAIEKTLGSTEWLYWRSSYSELHVSLATGLMGRVVLIAVAGALAVSFVALVPRRTLWFTRLGSASLVVYLFHGFLVKLASYSAFPDWAADHPVTSLVVTTLVAVPVALLLASPPVASRLNIMVDPVGTWQRRRRRQATSMPLPPGSHVGRIEPRGMHSSARVTSALGA